MGNGRVATLALAAVLGSSLVIGEASAMPVDRLASAANQIADGAQDGSPRMLPASAAHRGTTGHRDLGLEIRVPVLVSKDRCRAIWKIPETLRHHDADSMAANVLFPSVAAAVPIKPRHRFDRTDIQRLAEHVAG